jgi:hypothetical protein
VVFEGVRGSGSNEIQQNEVYERIYDTKTYFVIPI